jgi:hypothetical protein
MTVASTFVLVALFFNIAQSINMIGVYGPINNLYQHTALRHTQKTSRNISIPHDHTVTKLQIK